MAESLILLLKQFPLGATNLHLFVFIQVDGTSVLGHTNHQAVELLRSTGPVVSIKFERYLRGPKYEQLQQAIRANELRPPSPPFSDDIVVA
jgi:hypothetical protein